MMTDGPIWLVGCGNMGGAMLRGWLAAGMYASAITVIDPFANDLPNGVAQMEAPPAGQTPRAVVLAVKPQMLGEVAARLAPCLTARTILLSILAGAETTTLRKHFPAGQIVRAMPNLPAKIGQGVTALYNAENDEVARREAEALVTPLGDIEWLSDEIHFHAVTALSGSGPAFVFRFIDAMTKGGAKLGLPHDQALRLALATISGSTALAAQSDVTPQSLAEQVRSPNGTTHAGLEVLDAGNIFAERVALTLEAAARRSEELSKAD